MTRAKNDLHLIAPLKYYVTSQPKMGDRHVYGARSRFLTRAVMATLEPVVWPDQQEGAGEALPGPARIDVAGKLRRLWT
jgi:DNA helicase-2/ATP-dependent DNA helicase PcrA